MPPLVAEENVGKAGGNQNGWNFTQLILSQQLRSYKDSLSCLRIKKT